MKYIPAEKLIAEIYKHIGKYDSMLHEWSIPEVKGKREEAFSILTIVESLQQEQPKEICSKCIHHGKDDDCCYYPHGGMQSKINENGVYECTGFYEKEQEQPEVDLDKEIVNEWIKCRPIDEGMGSEYVNISVEQFDSFAHHFYELGLNARKK